MPCSCGEITGKLSANPGLKRQKIKNKNGVTRVTQDIQEIQEMKDILCFIIAPLQLQCGRSVCCEGTGHRQEERAAKLTALLCRNLSFTST